ncbi:phosphopantetheine-binding protein [Streptomyces spectabilis]|uniref:Acyl carrier protein n=1 Tax=Streptomyces spectabilis TaxID=68270 RepID=A0A5P2X5E2_STRST|nr:phosphopantetheine-binding protein [Streptomyces spectabilis]MBB5100976.1 acyl carrier protein [Streptomyces spectabilis]MCI3900189.1 phosphopantetheine-binding protein [Streptomyces spectabilis]QEV57796.1 acyl carrier protein [Streptomyces spectabilis]GGV08798.1 hypothetical protein GCM10010245_16510 [Streptomyces spectabilis]
MTATATTHRVSTLLSERFGVPVQEVHADARLKDLDLDSLALVEFALVAEEEFGVRLTEDDVTTDDTVADLARMLQGKGGDA